MKKTQKMVLTSLDKVITEKLVSDNVSNPSEKKNPQQIDSSKLYQISKHTSNAISNADKTLDLFPDMEIGIQILVSSILSPKDFITVNLTYVNDTFELPTQILHDMNEVFSTHVNKNYKLTDKLYKILEESIFLKGAYVESFIPENAINSAMFGDVASLESFTANIDSNLYNSLSEENSTYSSESLEGLIDKDLKEYLSFSDNPVLLDASNRYLNQKEESVKLTVGAESLDNIPIANKNRQLLNNIFKKVPVNDDSEIVSIHTATNGDRKPLGVPLVIKLPIESVIPLTNKNDPSSHLGYFVLLDEVGQPITESTVLRSEEDDLRNRYFSNDAIKKAASARFKLTEKAPLLEKSEAIVHDIIDRKIREKLEKGHIKDLVDFESLQEIYGTMFRRVMSKQKTKMLFLPKELVSYIAFDHKKNGVGRSMLEKVSVLASMRAILLITRLNATVRNNSSTTKVTAKLDPKDTNPTKTMEKIIATSLESRVTQFPLGVNNLNDLVDWSHKYGFFYEFDHPSLPDMQIETEERTTDYKEPEGILDEELRKSITMSFGLTPEMIENGFDANFAASIIASNALFAKRVKEYRKKFIPMLNSHIGNILVSDYKIRKELKAYIEMNLSVIKNNMAKEIKKEITEKNISDNDLVEYLLEEYIATLGTNLPSIEVFQEDGLSEAFEKYKSNIEDYVEIFFSEDALPEELIGQFEGKADAIRMAIINTLLRRWMHENNYMVELLDLFSSDKFGNRKINPLDEFNAYITQIEEGIKDYFKKTKKVKKKLDRTVDKFDAEEEEEDVTNNPITPEEGDGDEIPPEEEGDEKINEDEI